MNSYFFSTSLDAYLTDNFSGTYLSESSLFSHQKKTTSIAGFVTDSFGFPLSGIQVTLHDLAGNYLGFTTYTTEDGFYYFIDLDPGDYLVRVTLSPDIFVDTQTVAIDKELVQVDFILEV